MCKRDGAYTNTHATGRETASKWKWKLKSSENSSAHGPSMQIGSNAIDRSQDQNWPRWLGVQYCTQANGYTFLPAYRASKAILKLAVFDLLPKLFWSKSGGRRCNTQHGRLFRRLNLTFVTVARRGNTMATAARCRKAEATAPSSISSSISANVHAVVRADVDSGA